MYRIIGRVDDVINVSGHRIGTAEVENAINQHPKVIESAVVGYPHDIKGQGIYAYVITAGQVADEKAFSWRSLPKSLALSPSLIRYRSFQACRKRVPEKLCAVFCGK